MERSSDDSDPSRPFEYLSKDRSMEILKNSSDRIVSAVTSRFSDPIRRYEGWDVADILLHTGQIHRWVHMIIGTVASARLQKPSLPTFRKDREQLLQWFRDRSEQLLLSLASIDPATPVWTFSGDGTARFWLRRMAMETVTHAWDAESAGGEPIPFDRDGATTGFSESLALHLPDDDDRLRGNGENVLFDPIDAPDAACKLVNLTLSRTMRDGLQA